MRRLTPAELDRTLTDLLGTTPGLAATIMPPEAVGGFSNNVDVRPVGADTVDAYARLATAAAAEYTADPEAVLACDGLFDDIDLTVEAETGTTDTGTPQSTDMGLFSEGYVEVGVTLDHDGDYMVEALLRGTACESSYADWALLVDGTLVASGISEADWTWEGAEVPLTAGDHAVRVVFGDDCYLEELGQDRNLFVDAVRVHADSLPVGDPGDFSTCASGWLADFVTRAWRRPLEDPEDLPRLLDFYDAMAETWGPVDAMRLVVEVVLQSPRFLYRVEDSVLEAAADEVVVLDGYELASRLSYFLWGTMPDAELMAAAAAGELDTVEGLEAYAAQMLEDPRATEVVELFFEEWMDLDHIDEVEKDPTVYPDWTDDRPESFREETMRFVRTVWEDEGARFDTLITASWTIADGELAAFYGYEGAEADWGRVERDPSAHAGLLTQGAFLASRARSYGSSPIHRGMFIRGSMLCHVIPAPDPSLEIEIPDPDPDATTRETLEQHRADPVCAACHDLIDPPGLTFEHFDGIGRYRTEENGLPVDASVDMIGTDFDGFLYGAAELGQAMSRSTLVRECFARQWFRFAHGRREATGDVCEIQASADAFAADDLDMKSLILATITSPAFRSAVGSL